MTNAQKAQVFSLYLKSVAEELHMLARHLDDAGTTETMGEVGLSTYALEAQGALWELLVADGLLPKRY